ncbi:prepilin peptidase [Herbiconiux sp. CPCC 205716]|uniref:Prepilin peptidase n=1 Tax=Herbiconiux gentiana TaxID=2970912 RepID=A0ABT2GGD5_9MICO|nr:prepilin peptidase [Herbiconiux gentiana]MCS5715289.1 prepilin peptidase [Herbiconiux gentiana]
MAVALLLTLVPLGHLAAVSVPLAVTDARTGRLPNGYLLPGLALLAWALVAVGLHDPPLAFEAAAAALAAGAVAAALWALGVLGMGDVKLLVLLGGVLALLEPLDGGAVVQVAFCAGALVLAGLVVALGGGRDGRDGKEGLDGREGRTPLGPALLGAFWLGLMPSLGSLPWLALPP